MSEYEYKEVKLKQQINPHRAWWQFWKPPKIDLIVSLQIKSNDTVYFTNLKLETTNGK